MFPAFRPCDVDSDLYRRGRSWVSEHEAGDDRTRSDREQLVAAFRADVEGGRLPQVSWIVTAADLSEHSTAESAKGEHVTARLIEALVDNPEVFAKTAFLLLYDESGGFFDHAPPPVPPVGDYRGHSTVPIAGRRKPMTLRRNLRLARTPSALASGRRRSSCHHGRAAERLLRTVRPHLGPALPGGAFRRP